MLRDKPVGRLEGVNATTVVLLGWTGVIIMAGITPLNNFVGHAHWDFVQWTVTARHLRSPKFYFDVFANITLFFPLGLLLARQYPFMRDTSKIRLAAVGLLLSFGIEYFQIYCHNRHPSLIDLISNSIGTAVGVQTAPTVFAFRLLSTWLPPPYSHPTGS